MPLRRESTTTHSEESIAPLARFTKSVEEMMEEGMAEATLVQGVASALAKLLKEPGWLSEEHRQGWPDRYRSHVLYVAPDGSYSVVALVWLPGQSTPIHDHVAWCCIGVLQGKEKETRYLLFEDQQSLRFLVPAGQETFSPGKVTTLIPPEQDIHEVENSGQGKAISIHVYGADINKLGSSINQTFELPVRPQPGAARRVRWGSLS